MFTLKIADTERNLLTNAFPPALRQDVEEVIKVLPFDRKVLLADVQIHQVDSLIHSNEQTVSLDSEVLKIPYRIYFNEPMGEKEKQLTLLQKTITNCIYLRHHNGFVRQRRLEQLLNCNDYFVIPYTFQLLGDYVIEIIEVLDKHVNDQTISNYIKFIDENPEYWQQTESRVISYWNEYYRRPIYPEYLPPKHATRNEYIGQQLVDRLKKANALRFKNKG
jgi:hypothetical protein